MPLWPSSSAAGETFRESAATQRPLCRALVAGAAAAAAAGASRLRLPPPAELIVARARAKVEAPAPSFTAANLSTSGRLREISTRPSLSDCLNKRCFGLGAGRPERGVSGAECCDKEKC